MGTSCDCNHAIQAPGDPPGAQPLGCRNAGLPCGTGRSQGFPRFSRLCSLKATLLGVSPEHSMRGGSNKMHLDAGRIPGQDMRISRAHRQVDPTRPPAASGRVALKPRENPPSASDGSPKPPPALPAHSTSFDVALIWLWGRIGVALGCLSVGYQQALGWLWGGFG